MKKRLNMTKKKQTKKKQTKKKQTKKKQSVKKKKSIKQNKLVKKKQTSKKISRKVKSLTVIFRSCSNVNMLTQNKKRLFEKEKSEYTFRSLNSILLSIENAKK